MRIFPLYVFSCLLVASSLPGQSAYKPKLVNSKDGSHHDFPLQLCWRQPVGSRMGKRKSSSWT